MTPTITSAADFPIAELATLFNTAFTGYIAGTPAFNASSLLALLCRDNVDLTLSRVMVEDAKPLGFGLISRQGWAIRVAAMGIVPEAQEKKLGTWLMGQLIDEARARGERTMQLEVIEQNTRAVKLYQRAGFGVLRRLTGYTGITMRGVADPDLTEVDIYEVAKQVLNGEGPDLPWQLSGTAIARMGLPNRAYRLGSAWAVITDPTQPKINLRAFFTAPDAQRQGHGTRLLQALVARYPDKPWAMSAICPEEFGVNFLEKRGFRRTEISQFQMKIDL